MSQELKPCPFCGSTNLNVTAESSYVMCYGCDADGPVTRPTAEAIAAWNNRVAPVPPAGGEMKFDKLAHEQVLTVCRTAAFNCSEQHSYMAGLKTDYKNWFPHKWVIDAMRALIGVNQSTCSDLRAHVNRLQAENAATQQRLNVADQRIDELTAERSPKDYAIEHAEYLATAADNVQDAYKAYSLAQVNVDEGGDEGEDEVADLIDSAREDLHEALHNLRGMTYEFRKRRDRATSK